MFSRALIPKLNVLDLCVLKGQSRDKDCLCKIFWQHFANQRNRFYIVFAKFFGNILQIRETGFTSRVPLFEIS
jgi:hypothetical protein